MKVFIPLILFCSVSVWAEPFYQAELMFPLQGKHVHSSSIVELPNGDLRSCWFYGSGERSANDVVVQGSRLAKGSNEWEKPYVLADTPDLPDCNPVLFIDGKDRLRLVWIAVIAAGWENSLLRTKFSEDYLNPGPPVWNWQDVIILKPGEEFPKIIKKRFDEFDWDRGWAEYAPEYEVMIEEAAKDPRKRQTGWMPRIQPTTLPSGRILLPLYSDGFNVSLCAISDDGGDTWRASGPMVGMGPIQPTICRRKDGTLVAWMRDSGDMPPRVMESTSSDDGETWTAAVDTDIPNPGSSLTSLVLDSGEWVLVHNDTEEGRRSLSCKMSDDEGKTWKWERHLEKHPVNTFAYPNMIQTKDGLIHVSYSYKEEGKGASIKHVAINKDWVKQGD
ncbi:MAG: exo-alpha-sialidase [Candidatus Omnitrophica bacterium]|nr:exo-alpha-sialidase [Candidatus Omnitrophota bacterium]